MTVAARGALRILSRAAVLFAGLLVAGLGSTAVAGRYGNELGWVVLIAAAALTGAAWSRCSR